MSDKKTVRVRIAVAVNAKGEWSAFGYYPYNEKKMSDSRMADSALECLDCCGAETVHFIEATIPLPESVTVQGEVVK